MKRESSVVSIKTNKTVSKYFLYLKVLPFCNDLFWNFSTFFSFFTGSDNEVNLHFVFAFNKSNVKFAEWNKMSKKSIKFVLNFFLSFFYLDIEREIVFIKTNRSILFFFDYQSLSQHSHTFQPFDFSISGRFWEVMTWKNAKNFSNHVFSHSQKNLL